MVKGIKNLIIVIMDKMTILKLYTTNNLVSDDFSLTAREGIRIQVFPTRKINNFT